MATTAAIAAMWFGGAGCADPPTPRSAGDTCGQSSECESNLCYQALCLEPAADDDGDGLTNAVEAQLGTHVNVADTDGDGLSDYAEVQGNLTSPPDEDGDGIIDALECALVSSQVLAFSETDDDCLAPQKDPEDGVQNQDEAWVADLACCCYGTCSKADVVPVSYSCDTGEPVCTFAADDDLDGDGLLAVCDDDDDGDAVADADDCAPQDPTRSSAEPERCDGTDTDCDGEIDEDWPDLGIACLTAHADCGGLAFFECGGDGAGVICPAEPATEGAACDDGNPETHADHCDAAGNCGGTACVDSAECRTFEVLDGQCVYLVVEGACFVDGACRAEGEVSPAGPCQWCDPFANPEGWTYRDAGTPCDDGDECTKGESCTSDASCLGTLIDCEDDWECTVDSCDSSAGCQHVEDSAQCDDGIDCTTNTCSAAEGCLFTPVHTECDEGDPCWSYACDLSAGCEATWAKEPDCLYDCEVTHVLVAKSPGFMGSSTGHAAYAGDTAYIVQQDNSNELRVVDWSDPAQPVELLLQAEGEDAGLPKIGIDLPHVNLPRRVWAAGGDQLYISSSKGLALIDVSNPQAPVVAAYREGFNTLYGMAPHPVQDLLYLAVETGGVAVADITSPDTLSVVVHEGSSVDVKTYDVAVGHNTLFLVGADLSLFAYDITVPSSPEFIGDLEGIADPTSLAQTRVAVQGDLAVLASNRDGYRLVDVSDPANMSVHFDGATPTNNHGVHFFEGYLLLGAKEGLHILDIADPANPVSVMETDGFSTVYGLGLVGHRVLVSTSAHLLQVFDLTVPCTDGDPCTLDACSTSEACDYPPTSCDDLDPCTTDSCVPDGGCAFEAILGCAEPVGP